MKEKQTQDPAAVCVVVATSDDVYCKFKRRKRISTCFRTTNAWKKDISIPLCSEIEKKLSRMNFAKWKHTKQINMWTCCTNVHL
mmetsp:Transcript_27503/g.50071  ORF Transcript_27503/g.50071 Transcript_27503/m.50071 type:complete len:84 (+) Transcript_27503:1143-1394(+)